jgi:DcuC family C4-dicarboxylate transporter
MFVPELVGFAAAVVTFTVMSRRPPKESINVPSSLVAETGDDQPIRLVEALLPPLPIAMLLLLQPRFQLFPPVLEIYPDGLPVSHAMMLSAIVALFVDRKDLSARTKSFFEGAGFAYVNVISLIITATCFIRGMETVGLTQMLVSAISGSDFFGKAASGFFPWVLAVLGGSGTAPAVAFCKAVLPSVSALDVTAAIDLGVLAAVGASFGRTMSPVAAVVFFTSALLNVTPIQIVKRTAPALGVAAAAVFAFMLVR